jgi:hypothetical protein
MLSILMRFESAADEKFAATTKKCFCFLFKTKSLTRNFASLRATDSGVQTIVAAFLHFYSSHYRVQLFFSVVVG